MKALAISLTSIILWVSSEIIATYKTDSANSQMVIAGTSTMHDWEMTAENMEGTMDVNLYEDRLEINSLKLKVPVESLKSGKDAMDKNAYKALKYEDHKSIKYDLVSVKEIEKTGDGEFHLVTNGRLTVAGKTRVLLIPIKGVVHNKKLTLKGSTSFKMTDFGVEPPSFMFGAVSTGDEITIHFNINYKQ